VSTAPLIPKPSEQPGVGRAAKVEPIEDLVVTHSVGRAMSAKAKRIEDRRKARGDI
jgi:hypothetical protein